MHKNGSPANNINSPLPVQDGDANSSPANNNNNSLFNAKAKDEDRNGAPRISAFRPRLLYSATFVWNTLTVGKFTAPLLQQLSPRFSDSVVGFTFALQYGVVACLTGWGGALADAQERTSSSWGWGRLKVLTFAITLGTLAFLGHGLPDYMRGIFPNNSSTGVLVWHISMRCMYAISMGITAPCLDGLGMAHLDRVGASSADFGKERMYGALFWGLGTLVGGIGIDYYGFNFLYTVTAINTLASYIAIGVYTWGLSRDTTGAFESLGRDIDKQNLIIRSEDQHEDAWHANEKDEVVTKWVWFMVFKTGYGKAIIFLLFTVAMGMSVVDNLAFIFFDSLGASSTMDGWTVFATSIFEIPVFFVAPLLLERYGPGRLVFSAGLAYVIRVVGYTLVPANQIYTMYIILMLEMLHGVVYAGSTGSVEFIANMMPKGYEASSQGVVMFVSHFGVVAGLIMAGCIQERYGARLMFRVMAGTVLVGMAVFVLAVFFCDKPQLETAKEDLEPDETCNLIKSESCASSASAFADVETERYVKALKYDSLNKWVKDW